jgi:aminoglycoside N3'-acetyltransferase
VSGGCGVCSGMSVEIGEIRAAVVELGLGGMPLCVHSSLRSFGWVDGGADTVIDGLLAEGCTVMVPAFTQHYVLPPDEVAMRPARNAWEYEEEHDAPGVGRVYSPDTTEIEGDLGTLPRTVVRREGRVRGGNPLNSFAAVGPLAHELIDGQAAMDVYAPLRALAGLGGSVVMMGVGLTSMTLIHLAEQEAGRALFVRWANGADGDVVMVEVGSCSDGFRRLEPALQPIERRVNVGESVWRVFPAGEAVQRAAAAIRAEPGITRCANESCTRCRDGVAGGPILGT